MCSTTQCPQGTTPYIIRAGDTIFSLAQRFNTTVEAISAVTPAIDPEDLKVGQRYVSPVAPTFHPNVLQERFTYIVQEEIAVLIGSKIQHTCSCYIRCQPGYRSQ